MAQVKLAGAVTLHDFAATENHLVIPVPPLRLDLLSLVTRKQSPIDCMRWHPELGTELIVIPLADPGNPIRLTVPAHHVEHIVNAYEDGTTIHFDAIRYPNLEARAGYIRGLIHGFVGAPLGAVVSHGTLDLATRRCVYETRIDRPCELPRVSLRVEASRYRFGYALGFSSPSAERDRFFDAIVKFDIERGSRETWWPGPGQFVTEPVFVGSGAKGEDDGFVLAQVLDMDRAKSYLAVLDARAITDGPIARAYFDQVIPLGFHGVWVPS